MKSYLLLAVATFQLAVACPAIPPPSRASVTTAVPEPTASAVNPPPVIVKDPTPEDPAATPVSTPTTAAATPSRTAEAATPPKSSAGDDASVSGKSTFYGGNTQGGMCSFSTYTIPSGLFGTAFSGSAWDSAANCGACVRVTGPNGNSITAMIVDQCPECDKGHLDLFQDAFAKLGDISAGIIPTSYTFVPCGISSPLVLHNKSGTSAYWFSMQVVNANEPVASLEVSTDGGSSWQKTQRAQYNFFENQSGFGTESVDVRVTSRAGKTIVVKNVSVASDASVTASSNF
ncbi:uncharacterized protein E0L32_005330 [Thyridium curvatum]|uniref:Expansin-like EG45 domain-containing protein n=1 Tax=Thyridium curvatum TaxID=1093900 RepID=A0A507BD02_9PEZI|nr:uncharacterized protein E0L32_005330 [Thyridium curvatum]TPX14638.1 hypothetical protein E0L32_005330 [Thyridium curvatum]